MSIDRTTLILLDAKTSRHAMNALLGALESDRELDGLEVRPAAGEAQLAQCLAETQAARRQPVAAVSYTTPQLWRVRDMMTRLAAVPGGKDRGVPWVAGGPHPTADPEGTLRLGFDIVVRGEGEATLPELLKTMAVGGDLAGVAGVSHADGSGEARHTPRREPIDLDALPPFPTRRWRRIGPIEITRGCPFACGYCQTSHLLGMQPRHRGVEAIVRHASEIAKREPCDVRVITPNAFSYGSPDGRTLNLAALESLLTALRATLGTSGRLFFGTFPSEVRPEHVNHATLELVKHYANNDYLVIGAQSGSDRLLEHCRRGHTAADVLSAAAATLAAGLKAHVDFIFGLPGETEEDAGQTIEVIRELAAMGALIHAHAFMPLPRTKFAKEPPPGLSSRLRLAMKEWIRNGTLYGTWHQQEREARRISRYLRHGEL